MPDAALGGAIAPLLVAALVAAYVACYVSARRHRRDRDDPLAHEPERRARRALDHRRPLP